MSKTAIEQRLLNLEKEVSALRRQVSSMPAAENWLENLIGSVSDESALLEALEYGRKFRQSDKPTDDSDEQS